MLGGDGCGGESEDRLGARTRRKAREAQRLCFILVGVRRRRGRGGCKAIGERAHQRGVRRALAVREEPTCEKGCVRGV